MNLKQNATYRYSVRLKLLSQDEEGKPTDWVQERTFENLTLPSKLNVQSVENGLQIYWNEVNLNQSDADYFKIRLNENHLLTVSLKQTQATLQGLEPCILQHVALTLPKSSGGDFASVNGSGIPWPSKPKPIESITVLNWPLTTDQLIYWPKPSDISENCSWSYAVRQRTPGLSETIWTFDSEGPHLLPYASPGKQYLYSVQIQLAPFHNLTFSHEFSAVVQQESDPLRFEVINVALDRQLIRWNWTEGGRNETYDLIQRLEDGSIQVRKNVISPVLQDGLLPSTDYTYTIIAREANKPRVVSSRFTLQSLPAHGLVPPSNVHVVPFENGLSVRWQHQNDVPSGQVDSFYVMINRGLKTMNVPNVHNGSYKVHITDLDPCSRYVVTILSCSYTGDCSSGQDVHAQTLPSVPGNVVDLKVDNIPDQLAQSLTWLPAKNIPAICIQTYAIRYGVDGQEWHIRFSESSLDQVFSNLRPNTTYFYSVQVTLLHTILGSFSPSVFETTYAAVDGM
ncbi:hypothetical protein CRM22_000098 [Opisthorchis felineus]|uniref:Fibronectin type-III domain-containing protein n=1 Tax=Opisthorchis felineus TaxID=147828 RepID=A0A4V3SHE4_OPIFE|nr:hypothetical protein CRM22_000098 [Opisthorchis felineus]